MTSNEDAVVTLEAVVEMQALAVAEARSPQKGLG